MFQWNPFVRVREDPQTVPLALPSAPWQMADARLAAFDRAVTHHMPSLPIFYPATLALLRRHAVVPLTNPDCYFKTLGYADIVMLHHAVPQHIKKALETLSALCKAYSTAQPRATTHSTADIDEETLCRRHDNEILMWVLNCLEVSCIDDGSDELCTSIDLCPRQYHDSGVKLRLVIVAPEALTHPSFWPLSETIPQFWERLAHLEQTERILHHALSQQSSEHYSRLENRKLSVTQIHAHAMVAQGLPTGTIVRAARAAFADTHALLNDQTLHNKTTAVPLLNGVLEAFLSLAVTNNEMVTKAEEEFIQKLRIDLNAQTFNLHSLVEIRLATRKRARDPSDHVDILSNPPFFKRPRFDNAVSSGVSTTTPVISPVPSSSPGSSTVLEGPASIVEGPASTSEASSRQAIRSVTDSRQMAFIQAVAEPNTQCYSDSVFGCAPPVYGCAAPPITHIKTHQIDSEDGRAYT